MSNPYCWCPVCKQHHYLYGRQDDGHNGIDQWFVYNCPFFLSHKSLVEYTKVQLRKKPKKQYPTVNKKKPKQKPKKNKAIVKNPKTHWHVDVEDISNGKL